MNAPESLPAAPPIAAQLYGAEYAAITLRDAAGHHAVATAGGLAIGLMPRDTRFCCEVLHSGAPLEVSDAGFDMRFHDDPFVCAGPRIRFYSGVPLVAIRGASSGP